MFDAAFQQSAVFNLMTAIRDELINPGPLFQRPSVLRPRGFQIGVQGTLQVVDHAAGGTYPAKCTVVGSTNWAIVPLKVFCTEKWIRRETDWHLIKENTGLWYLCYEFHDRWRDRIEAVAEHNDASKAIEFAAKFCVHGSRWLIEKHLFAYRHNITKWPDEWPAYAHEFAAARLEYQRELRKAG